MERPPREKAWLTERKKRMKPKEGANGKINVERDETRICHKVFSLKILENRMNLKKLINYNIAIVL